MEKWLQVATTTIMVDSILFGKGGHTARNIYKRERKENLEEKKTQGLQSQLATPFIKYALRAQKPFHWSLTS